jgi:hypothetical protein
MQTVSNLGLRRLPQKREIESETSQNRVRLDWVWVSESGQFGLSLGRLLSKGGMMKAVVPVSRPLVGQRSEMGRTGEREE